MGTVTYLPVINSSGDVIMEASSTEFEDRRSYFMAIGVATSGGWDMKMIETEDRDGGFMRLVLVLCDDGVVDRVFVQ